jgi:acetaldehyde dehydrogenase
MSKRGHGTTRVAIIGSGNIGTDLMIKVMRTSDSLEMGAMVGIDQTSEGLARAQRMGVPVTAHGVEGLLAMDGFDEIEIIFDATSAKAHVANAKLLQPLGKRMVDMTPAAIGPFVVPSVNLDEHLSALNVNMVTCGGQATIPIVAAVNAVSPVAYGEIVASISSRSAGPGTRANIDEFTETTSHAIEEVGGARRGKAIIILNPAEPPMLMRDTVYCLVADGDTSEITAAIEAKVDEVRKYVPGYRLKQAVQFERYVEASPLVAKGIDWNGPGLKVTVFLEVEGAAHYLPAYAGNLDIMTSAALITGERIAALEHQGQP